MTEHTCSSCHGSGTCNHCNGTGTDHSGNKCLWCLTVGVYNTPSQGSGTCNQCAGRGTTTVR